MLLRCCLSWCVSRVRNPTLVCLCFCHHDPVLLQTLDKVLAAVQAAQQQQLQQVQPTGSLPGAAEQSLLLQRWVRCAQPFVCAPLVCASCNMVF